MAWVQLVVAGLLEIVWALAMKRSDGFQQPGPTALTIGAMLASFALLGLATRDLPIGTAYAVWVGIGATGTAIAGIVWLHEPVSSSRLFFLALLLVAIVGLKRTTPG